ncbi:MAG: helix-turn-helix transcriptional regulator [Bacillota bacterium]|nr:helix-turn-helix transcriptional regulator [Bacillota bacterium]
MGYEKIINNKIPVDFGNYLKDKRLENKWSLRTLAAKIGITATYLNDIETGNRPAPPEDKLMIIAKIFNIDLDTAELYKYLDLAAETRNTIPIDIEKFLISNPMFIDFIRKITSLHLITVSDVNELLQNIKK